MEAWALCEVAKANAALAITLGSVNNFSMDLRSETEQFSLSADEDEKTNDCLTESFFIFSLSLNGASAQYRRDFQDPTLESHQAYFDCHYQEVIVKGQSDLAVADGIPR